MSINDDRPDAGGEGAGDQNREFDLLPGFDSTSFSATVKLPDWFLLSLKESQRGPLSKLVRKLSAHQCELFFEAGELARHAVKHRHPFGADTLPAAMRLLHGLEVRNDKSRSIMVAAVVCAWPDEFRGRVTLRDPDARRLIASGWRPDLPTERRGRTP